MARTVKSAAGVTRIGGVYTPPGLRRQGYATTCVTRLSQRLVEQHEQCILHTQLSNPTSNAIYQRIGYEPVADMSDIRCADADR